MSEKTLIVSSATPWKLPWGGLTEGSCLLALEGVSESNGSWVRGAESIVINKWRGCRIIYLVPEVSATAIWFWKASLLNFTGAARACECAE